MTKQLNLIRELPLQHNKMEAFNPRGLARRILRTTRQIALATLDRHNGFPYSTITNLSVEPDGTPVFYGAGLSHHTKNIFADPRISITLSQAEGRDVLRDRRMTLIGNAHKLEGATLERARSRYRRKFFRSWKYLGLEDSCMFRLEVEGIHLNGGPARYSDTLTATDLSVELRGAECLMREEDRLIEHLESLPSKRKTISALLNGVRGDWHISTIDPEGVDVASETTFYRLAFRGRVESPEDLLAAINRRRTWHLSE
ncbi:HugZ family protein [Celeribacter sp.]|uniref:HugZ family pyridoxamine 5'-phosphate oxidase n=1 Tax=Celeribacter sp. TaxID=1890673 RepID=UPI003A906C34